MGVASSYRISISDSVFSDSHCMNRGSLGCSLALLLSL